ncbi:DUF1003 domain-containing protein [Cloacibacterium sp. TD35]|uniref:DUF1003 domain-containing protein n=1 Tax=Cloacibacterium sp. TD35 TaxID=2976818 RepID=UPI00237DBC4E|nr:DUF1003 domain-containing protein [Cloacibacterium sp. TD35]WDT67269.1 DUF1003 domain-containing protein [Cloacibacterium sp. TD35]
MSTFRSDLSGKEFPENERVSAKNLRQSLLHFINKTHPNFSKSCFLSIEEMNEYREKYISEFLNKKLGNLTEVERQVIQSVSKNTMISTEVEEDEQEITFGQKLADKVAEFGGSWGFIIFFMTFLVAWILLNVFWLSNHGFDPFPFILLNLILSCIAAIQAPVIMMSQNRQEEKDRERSKKDYKINLKSELEIRELHEKIDHLIIHYQQDLLEIQKTQIDLLENILHNVKKE